MDDLPYALGCPSCGHFVYVSKGDPDCSLSDMYDHISRIHAEFDRARTEQLLAKVRDLTRSQVVID